MKEKNQLLVNSIDPDKLVEYARLNMAIIENLDKLY